MASDSDPAKRDKAYASFLAGNGDEVKGVVALARGLRKVGSKYPLVVAVLSDVPKEYRERLEMEGCVVKEVEWLYPRQNRTLLASVPFVANYSKLCVWKFEEYRKMIYLNGDVQVYSNIDHLFNLPDGEFHAPLDCLCEKPESHTPECQQYCPAVSTWPQDKFGSTPPLYFNTGMFVFQPSTAVFEDLLKSLEIISPHAFAEQHVLNKHYGKKFEILPTNYFRGLTWLQHSKQIVDPDEVKVVRYCTPEIWPWRFTPERKNLDIELVEKMKKKWLSVDNYWYVGMLALRNKNH